MQSKPDGNFRYSFQTVYHFSKFHIIFPLKCKDSSVVAEEIQTRVFSYFGLPKIIHSDNGSEFLNSVIAALVVLWPEKEKSINGGPGHSQSQRLVEQGNNSIENYINAREQEELNCCWSSWLPEIQCKKYLFIMIFVGF